MVFNNFRREKRLVETVGTLTSSFRLLAYTDSFDSPTAYADISNLKLGSKHTLLPSLPAPTAQAFICARKNDTQKRP